MIIRDFYEELKNNNFKPLTYTLYNKIDDDCYVQFLNKTYNEIYSIDDFEYYEFNMTDKERFLIKMYNSEYLSNVKKLKELFKDENKVKIIVDHNDGRLFLIKLKMLNIYD